MWLMMLSVAFADMAPPGPSDFCGCSVLGLIPIPVAAVALAMATMRRE